MDLEALMRICITLAQEAQEQDEVPIGAIVVYNGQVIGAGRNTREKHQSIIGHAEIRALEQASQVRKSWRLTDCTLITTLEPCVMCAGAIIQARISHLVYGADDPKGGAQTLFQLFNSNKLNHHVLVTSGVLNTDCSLLLKEFFKKKR